MLHEMVIIAQAQLFKTDNIVTRQEVIKALQFTSHKSVQKLFHNWHIIFLNSLMGFTVTCHLEKEPLKGLANVQVIFLRLFL